MSSATSNSISVTPGVATKWLITGQPPATVTAGTGFSLTVTAEDTDGNVATGYAGSATLSLAGDPAGGTLSGTTTVSATGRVAFFSGETLNRAGTGYTVQFSSGSITSATSSAISVTPGVATQLLIASQPPASVAVGSPFGLTVAVGDAEGNVVSGYSGNVTLALAGNPGGSTLGGVLTVAAANSVAVFSGLTLNKIGAGYALQCQQRRIVIGVDGRLQRRGRLDRAVAGDDRAADDRPGRQPVWVHGHGGRRSRERGDRFQRRRDGGHLQQRGQRRPGGALTVVAVSGVAVFSGLSLNNVASGYTLGVSTGQASATTTAIAVTPGTLTIAGAANDSVAIAFADATHFTVTSNGGTPVTYSTANVDKLVYNGPASAFSEIVFADPETTDNYAATQTFSSTTLIRSGGGFEFDAIGVANLYLYVSDPSSTATVGVAAGTGNFYVGDVSLGYSYIANPSTEFTASCRASAPKRSAAPAVRPTPTSIRRRTLRLPVIPREARSPWAA